MITQNVTQCIERQMQKVEQNFNPGLALIGLSGTSNDDGDSNENGKKGMGLDWHALCVFLAVTARLRRETA